MTAYSNRRRLAVCGGETREVPRTKADFYRGLVRRRDKQVVKVEVDR